VFGSTKELTIIATVMVLVGVLVALRGHYIPRPHQQPPAQTSPQ
jgi:hypothetical protein